MLLLLCFAATSAFAKEYTVFQKNKQFQYEGSLARSIEVKQGDTVRFQNEDTVFHNIISLSKILTFDTGAYDNGKFKVITFDKVGTVNVECAIHPRMQIEVVVGE